MSNGWRWAAVALLLAPAAVYLVILPFAGHLQYNDYYGILGLVVDGNHLSHDPGRWLTVKSNEHTVALSLLLYVLNFRLTGGDNLGLAAWSLAMMVASALLLWSLVPRETKESPRLAPALAAVLGTLALTPVAVHNIVLGFSGTLWLTANALALGAIRLTVTGARRGEMGWFAGAGLLGLAAAFAYSTGLAVWPTLLVLGLGLGVPWRRLGLLLVPAAADLAFEVLTYTRPAELPPPETGRPLLLIKFLAVYLGQIFARPRVAAGLIGLGCLAAAVLLAGWLLRRRRFGPELAPWLAVGVYGLTNAVVTAVARARLGGARSSRYATLAAFVWASLLVLAVWAVRRMAPGLRRRLAAAALAVGGVAGVGAMWVRGVGLFADYLDRAALQPVAEIAWRYGIRDPEVLRSVSVATDQLWVVRPWMQALGHLPFRGSPEVVPGAPPPGGVGGSCGSAEVRGEVRASLDGVVRVGGVVDGRWRGRRLVLVSRDGRVVGLGVRLRTPPVTRLDWPRRGVPWAGYLLTVGVRGAPEVLLEEPGGRWCRAGRLELSETSGPAAAPAAGGASRSWTR